jgi:Ni,Fe-hydrogenase III small subunit/formate hydrogenlyase subunit 6/NADH:ubiquinone oxidoreductase subunit I
MLRALLTRLLQGPRALRFPHGVPELPARFRGRPEFTPSRCANQLARCGAASPLPLIGRGREGGPTLDLGVCQFSPEEAALCEQGAITFTRDFRMASSSRDGLVVREGMAPRVRALDARARRLFGRSLKLRSVAAGSCGGCEAELTALGNVVFDLGRFGVQFVASPRHADGLVVTGIVNPNMRAALERTWEAVPEPRLVIAVGACAIGGGPFAGGAESGNGLPPSIPVDLWVPGCPPHPLTLLDGLLSLLGRIERGERGAGTGSD